MARLLALWGRICEWIGRRWVVVKDGLAAVRPTWVAALITVVAAAALQNAQALDALAEIAEGPWAAQLTLFGSVLLLAFAAWYFPRALLYVRYDRVTPPSPARHKPLRHWWPRLLGLLPLLSVALAYGKVGKPGHVVLYLLVAALFLAFLIRRRRGKPEPPLRPDLPTLTFRVAVGIQVLSVLFLIAFLISKVALPQFFGPLGILMLAAAMWISFVSMVLIYPTYRYTAPSGVLLLLLLAGVFSCFNDNHQVRRLAGPSGAREPFEGHVGGWKKERGAGDDYRAFVVAAEGGGIRAAYWTAAVLAQIEDLNPGFACHVFAISGVSGGSLGGAVFAALVADLVEAGELRCDGQPFRRTVRLGPDILDRNKRDPERPTANEILKQDFLAPTLAGLLFPDVVQRFLPLAGRAALPDRATYLEKSWEAAEERFQDPFLDLWGGAEAQKPNPRYVVPALFLNGTWVENGGRVVTTNLDIEKAASFVRLDDMLGCLDRKIRLSTAVHMSARFTYVSPAGTVRVAEPERCRAAQGVEGAELHVVDGGYFENSGAHTASEILDQLSGRLAASPLVISNNPENPNSPSAGRGEPKDHDRPFGETLSPVYALLNTRTARGFYAESYLASRSTETVRFQLERELTGRPRRGKEPEEADFPLGWTLSPETEARMTRQAAVSRQIVDVCRLLPTTGDPDRCRKVAETVVERCRAAYKKDRARCSELAEALGVPFG